MNPSGQLRTVDIIWLVHDDDDDGRPSVRTMAQIQFGGLIVELNDDSYNGVIPAKCTVAFRGICKCLLSDITSEPASIYAVH